jgi:hypothetical protein
VYISRKVVDLKYHLGIYLRMKAISLISAANVDTLASILSSIETRAKSCRIIEKLAYIAGTKLPIWAMIVISAIDRM